MESALNIELTLYLINGHLMLAMEFVGGQER